MIVRIAHRILREEQFDQISDRLIFRSKGRSLLGLDLYRVGLGILCVSRRSVGLLDGVCAFHQFDRIAFAVRVGVHAAGNADVLVIDRILCTLK